MTEPDKPQTPSFMDIFEATPTWTKALLGMGAGIVTLGMVAWALGMVDLTGPELGDGTTVSRACLDHFEESQEVRDNLPTRTASSVSWVGTDYTDAFFDCDSLVEWEIATSLYPRWTEDETDVEAFVRRTCAGSGELADSATCRSLE